MIAEVQKFEKRAEFLKAIAHPVRLGILKELCAKKTNVTSLYTKLCIPQSTISHHLLILKQAGVISGARHGLEINYSLDCESLEALVKMIVGD